MAGFCRQVLVQFSVEPKERWARPGRLAPVYVQPGVLGTSTKKPAFPKEGRPEKENGMRLKIDLHAELYTAGSPETGNLSELRAGGGSANSARINPVQHVRCFPSELGFPSPFFAQV